MRFTCWPVALSGRLVGQSFCITLGNDILAMRRSSASLATYPNATSSCTDALVMIGGRLASHARASMTGKPYQNSIRV